MTKAFSPCSQGTKSLENTNMHVNASLCCEQRFKKQTSQQRQIHSTVGTQRSSQLEDGDSGALLKENEKKKSTSLSSLEWASLVMQTVKNLPAIRETCIRVLS